MGKEKGEVVRHFRERLGVLMVRDNVSMLCSCTLPPPTRWMETRTRKDRETLAVKPRMGLKCDKMDLEAKVESWIFLFCFVYISKYF